MRLFALAFLTAAVAVSPLAAKDKKPLDPNQKICRGEVPTGSMMSKSICHTRAEWNQIDTANSRSTNDELSRSRDQQNQGAMRAS